MGEFSFILGTVARQLGILDDSGWNALVAASILSIALNPTIYRISRRLSAATPRLGSPAAGTRAAPDPRRCILVGYGPVGRIVHGLLVARGASVIVVDLNLDTVRKLKAAGFEGLYGDVLRPGMLEEAGIARAGSLILSADVENAAEIIRYARQLSPHLKILVRCSHLRDAAALTHAGADLVAAGEAEVGVALAEAVTAGDDVDPVAAARQRDGVRARLYQRPKTG